MASGSRYTDSRSIEWEPSGDPGFWVKTLYENSSRGERTLLMKLEPGATFPVHAHEDEWEQIYVLEGAFHDGEQTVTPGQFVCRAPGAPHSTTTEEGALVLLVYTRAGLP
jgi:quercetin dioxygenase-like cupin family protein